MAQRKLKSWLDQKLKDPVFKREFKKVSAKLSIAEQLILLRLDAGLTQAEVARRSGTTASAISRYENLQYDRYEIQTLKRIAKACGGRLRVVLVPA